MNKTKMQNVDKKLKVFHSFNLKIFYKNMFQNKYNTKKLLNIFSTIHTNLLHFDYSFKYIIK